MARLVYGANPVRELVLARAKAVSVVYVAAGAGSPALKDLVALCRNRQVAVEEREPAELDALAGAEARHQGAVAITGEFRYVEMEDVLDQLEDRGETPLVVVLDGVQDPHNLGAIVRSAHVMGAHLVVVPRDRAAPVTPAAVKASAGATEHMPIAQVTNVVRALETLKERGIWTYGAVVGEGKSPWEVDLKGPVALVLGGEQKGLRPLVQRACDFALRIPMAGRVASLNVSAAAAMLLYEVKRGQDPVPYVF